MPYESLIRFFGVAPISYNAGKGACLSCALALLVSCIYSVYGACISCIEGISLDLAALYSLRIVSMIDRDAIIVLEQIAVIDHGR